MKRKKLLFLAAGLLLLALAVGLFGVVRQQIDYRRGDTDYAAARETAGLALPPPSPSPSASPSPAPEEPSDPVAEELAAVDLAALRAVNPDVVGWIEIPGTVISYPVVQYSDNEYYLNHTWSGESNSVGAIFLECQVSPDFDEFNTIIYGHRMNNTSMFGALQSYQEEDFWEEHPSVYIAVDEGVYRYDVFAAFEPGVQDITYGLHIAKDSTKERFLQFSAEQSVLSTGIAPTAEDHILTLSTCTGHGHATRWVVQAVRAD